MRSPASRRCQQAGEPVSMPLARGAVTAAAWLYLTTRSASATVTGTTAWAALAGWNMWLAYRSQVWEQDSILGPEPDTRINRPTTAH